MRRLIVLASLVLGPLAQADSSYPLDLMSRETPADGRIQCPAVDLVTYGGDRVRYAKPVQIYAGFAPSLRAFEDIVVDTAIEVYGRAPVKLDHDGTYNCRRVRGYTTLLSEHALGNAIDVDGFEFPPAPKDADVPAGLRHGFSVSLSRHWNATSGTAAIHAHFLRLLAERVIAAGIFRVVLGPSYPGHEGHFHLDNAPYRLVHVFGFDPTHSSPI